MRRRIPFVEVASIAIWIRKAVNPIVINGRSKMSSLIADSNSSWSRNSESLAQYILRSPFSQQKMTYREDTQIVLYRSKMNPVLKKNFALFPVLDWIAEITAHIPNKREQLVRYYGAYSNILRGKRRKEKVEKEPNKVREVPPPLVS